MYEPTVEEIKEETLMKTAMGHLLKQDVCTSILDVNLNYKISPSLQHLYDELNNVLSTFTNSTNFKNEETNLQIYGIKYRLLLTQTMDEFLKTNANINIVSSDQMIFLQNVTVLGGKLQSYTQLITTASNYTQIYDKLNQTAILNELSGPEALKFLQEKKDKSGSMKRDDIKEQVTVSRQFSELKGMDDVILNIEQMLININIALVDSFIFLIFYGIPGTGKTAISEAIATQFSNGEYFKFDQSFFAAAYVGVTESRIRNIFDTIRSNPSKNYTIIIDEADNVLGTTLAQPHLQSIKILLQTEITSYESFGTNLIIICITNYLDRIEQTFKRRATNIIEILPPSHDECINFLEYQLLKSVKFNNNYRNSLKLDSNIVYTNSDMGRLAKNIKDTFLDNYTPHESVRIILSLEEEKLFIFNNTQNPFETTVTLNNEFDINENTYTAAMRKLVTHLKEKKKNLKNFEKNFAPSIQKMNLALINSSTLTKNDAKMYKKQ